MIKEDDELLKMKRSILNMKSSGILSQKKYDLYMKDISLSILVFVLKIKLKLIVSDIAFFSGYYLPSNIMTNFSEEDAKCVFKLCLDSFLDYTRLALQLEEVELDVKVVDDDIVINFIE